MYTFFSADCVYYYILSRVGGRPFFLKGVDLRLREQIRTMGSTGGGSEFFDYLSTRSKKWGLLAEMLDDLTIGIELSLWT